MIVSFVIEGFFFCFAKLKVSHGLLLDLSDGLFRSLPVSHTSFYFANLSEVQKIKFMPSLSIFEANLQFACLEGAILYRTNLSGATYNEATIWPGDFDPQAAGALLIE